MQRLGMLPHPEGGFYMETYRSPEMVNPEDGRGPRPASTAIVFLLGKEDVSHLHRIKSDEMWHFYGGGALAIYELRESTGSFLRTVIGPNTVKGDLLQYVVPKNTWFGAMPHDLDAEYSLVGCTVAPGFDFADFELGERERLVAEFPGAMDVVNCLTVNKTTLNEQLGIPRAPSLEASDDASPLGA